MSRENTLREIPAPPIDRVPRYSSRPFPAYRYVPGLQPHPLRDPAGHSYESSPLRSVDRGRSPSSGADLAGWLYGVDLFNAFFFWEAHEAWEGLWSVAPADSAQRLLFQGLIQVAAALLKTHMGVPAGAVTLSREGCAKLASAATMCPHLLGLDLIKAEAAFGLYFRVLDRGILPQIGPDVPVLRLARSDSSALVDG